MEDVLVIGGGAGGLNAALILARARRRVLVADAGAPRNAPAQEVHGFVSRDGTPPAELLAAGRAEVERYGGRVVTGAVRTIRRTAAGFEAELAAEPADRTVRARRVIVATGLHDELPDIPGLRDRWARDVLHCPYCHGWEVRDRPLGVLGVPGREAAAAHQALLVRQLSDDVVFFAATGDGGGSDGAARDGAGLGSGGLDGGGLSGADRARLIARGVRIVDGAIGGLVVEGDALRGVRLADGTVVARSALFVPARPVPHDALLLALGCERDDDGGLVRVDPSGRTSVPGVWAVGNVVDPFAHVVVAAAAGAKAALALNVDLIEEELAEHEPAEHELLEQV